jgi:hypothetical protein
MTFRPPTGQVAVPAPGLDHLCGKLTAAPVERTHYTAADAGTQLNHFAWVRSAGPQNRRIRQPALTRRPVPVVNVHRDGTALRSGRRGSGSGALPVARGRPRGPARPGWPSGCG